jgi:hypothetical protein
MISDELRTSIQNIIQGIGDEDPGDSFSEIRRLLIESFGPSRTSKKSFESKELLKKEQDRFLRQYAQQRKIWSDSLPDDSNFLARGGESKVYLSDDGLHVIKFNNARYYATWTEYFTNLLLHNLLFPSTAYNLIGFTEDETLEEGTLCIQLQQPFIEGDQAKLMDIHQLLTFNEFQNIKAQDYFNAEFRIVLEDMHDENVIFSQGLLFFIDTVFYVMDGE